MKRDVGKIEHNLFIKLVGPDGEIKEDRVYHNIITDVGRVAAMEQIVGADSGGAQPAKFNYVGIGEGTTSEVVGDTDIESEIGTRIQDTDPDYPSTGTGEIVATFPPGNGTGAITECGLLNHVSAGTLLARKTFSVINKAVGDYLIIVWQVSLT